MTIGGAPRPCLVIGASGDIGQAVATTLAKEGRQLALTRTGRTAGKFDLPSASWFECDLTSSASVNKLAATVTHHFGAAPDIVVASGIVKDRPLCLTSDEDWLQTLQVNLTGPFYVLRAFGRDLMAAGDAKVLLLGSVSGRLGVPGQASYAASKAALEALARVAAFEFGRFGVCVNVVAIGPVESEMVRNTSRAHVEKIVKRTALRKLSTSQDVAYLVASLLSQAGSFVTGQVVVMDGGLSAGAS